MNLKQRKRNWPLYYEITKPTRFDPGGLKTYWADEWEALQKSRQPAQAPDGPTPVNAQPPDQPAQVNVEPAQVSAESSQAIDQPADATAAVQLANATANPADPLAPNLPDSIASVYPEKPTARDPKDHLEKPTALYPEKPTVWASKGYPQDPTVWVSKGSPAPPDFARHARRCAVCSHSDRDAIEGDFIRWRSPELIAKEYNLPGRFTIYRHVHSTGLYAWRKQELGRVLEGILESAEHVPLESSDVIIRAARIYAHLGENGKWFEPPRTNFNFFGPAPAINPLESVLPTNSAHTRRRTAKKSPAGGQKANRNCRPDEGRHPERPTGVEGTLFDINAEAEPHLSQRGEQKANRNIHQIKKSVKSLKAKKKANS